MWSRRETVASGDAYLSGRDLVGRMFIEVFASRNPWAVKQFDYGQKKHHAEKMGQALELIVSCATRPKVLQHKLRVLALSHVQMGVKPEQIELFGEALFDLLEQVLGPYGAWDDATRDAWKWIWGIVQAVFVKHMETSAMMLDNLQKSWETIQERKVEEIIGRKFYERLFATAPELQPMFKKPFKMQVVMLVRALDLVVRSVQDTNVITTELKALAMTHIKYNINQSHLNVFGEVLVQTLKEVMGPHHWNGEIEAAWAAVYMHISEVFGQVLSSGRNLISKALADGSAGDLKRALQSMPRGKRALGALEIDVEDTAISPIVWSIQDGLLAMTEVLIKDLLIIRGDRESYYCGRDQQHKRQPETDVVLEDSLDNSDVERQRGDFVAIT
uniref:Hemoglobin-like flavoprotein n=1 Tax=Tetraselmis sp. GSL018 TaxID=582737 RepID=A0A061RFS7_9CHLO